MKFRRKTSERGHLGPTNAHFMSKYWRGGKKLNKIHPTCIDSRRQFAKQENKRRNTGRPGVCVPCGGNGSGAAVFAPTAEPLGGI